jgi:hypothetical protein
MKDWMRCTGIKPGACSRLQAWCTGSTAKALVTQQPDKSSGMLLLLLLQKNKALVNNMRESLQSQQWKRLSNRCI